MELYTINLKAYKRIFAVAFILNMMALAAGIGLVASHFFLWLFFLQGRNLRPIILFVLIGGSIFNVWFYKDRIAKLRQLESFEDKVAMHLKIYKYRIAWTVINCTACSFLYTITWRNPFLYLTIFDLVLSMGMYPNKNLIQKELQVDDIIFI